MDVPYWVAAMVFVGIIAALTLIIIQSVRLNRTYRRAERAEAAYDREILVNQKQKDAARAVVPYLAKTSVDMFYGEREGVQYNFAQRQEISRKVQTQNAALRAFNDVFGVSPHQEIMARANTGDPDAQRELKLLQRRAYAEDLGPDDESPRSTSPWQ